MPTLKEKYSALLGMTLEQAQTLVKRNQVPGVQVLRVSKQDGHSCILTMDYNTTRLNVELVKGVISGFRSLS